MAASMWWWERRGQWCANVTDPVTRKRLRWYLGAEEVEARRLFHVKMAELLGGDPRLPGSDPGARARDGDLTLAELAAAYLDWNELNRSYATWKSRRVYLRWIVEPFGLERAVDLRPAHVEQTKRVHQGKAPKSINHFVRAIKTLYNWAMDQGILEANPVARVKGVPRAPVKRKAVSVLTAVRACRRGNASPPLGDFMRLLLYTGMRSGELAGLPWDAYDRANRALIVGGHKTVGRSGQPRMIPLTARAVHLIERQEKGGAAIFSDPDGRSLTRNAFAQRWKRARGDCAVTFHALRHTFVSQLLARGVPEWEVQRLVGHASTLMLRYYAAADMQRMRAAVERL